MSREETVTVTELPNGKTLHRWTNPTGDEWACVAYDHGPMCRRCQPVTPTFAALLSLVMDGDMEITDCDSAGEFQWRLTVEGDRRAAHLIATNEEMGDMIRGLEDKDAR
jgi:hypothetical protein